MAMASNLATFQKSAQVMRVICRMKERGREQHQPYKVIEVTPPPKNLGVRCFPSVIELVNLFWQLVQFHGLIFDARVSC
ncbi:unnamed protein product [Rhodiola kirilowii]